MAATLHDVAARSGLSIATVSRAINGLPVSAKSKAQVDEAVSALGYLPNVAARTLRSDRSATVGVVFFNLRNTLGLELIDTLSEALEEQGYALLIASARGDAQRYDLLMRRFLERRVDGLFCIAPQGASGSLARYRGAGLPVLALFDRAGDFEDLPLFTPSFERSARAVADHLAARGHRRVALVRAGPSVALGAVGAALAEAGIEVHEAPISEAGGSAEALQTILSAPQPATAAVAGHPQARGLLAAARARRLAIPGDLDLVSVSEIGQSAQDQRLGLSALTVDPDFLGRAAGAAMLDWLGGREPPPLTRIEAATFAARGSTASA